MSDWYVMFLSQIRRKHPHQILKHVNWVYELNSPSMSLKEARDIQIIHGTHD